MKATSSYKTCVCGKLIYQLSNEYFIDSQGNAFVEGHWHKPASSQAAPETAMPKPLVSDESVERAIRFYSESEQHFAKQIADVMRELQQWREYGKRMSAK